MKRPRQRGSDGDELWRKVADSVTPLSGRSTADRVDDAPPPKPVTKLRPNPAPQPRSMPAKLAPAPLANAGLDGSWDRQIKRGAVDLDSVVDLHGCLLDQAWRRLDCAIGSAIDRGDRTVLVITGKPASDPASARTALPGARPRGVIRAKLADWLHASRHAAGIAAVRSAHPRHGGAGAVYVVLRRSTPRRSV